MLQVTPETYLCRFCKGELEKDDVIIYNEADYKCFQELTTQNNLIKMEIAEKEKILGSLEEQYNSLKEVYDKKSQIMWQDLQKRHAKLIEVNKKLELEYIDTNEKINNLVGKYNQFVYLDHFLNKNDISYITCVLDRCHIPFVKSTKRPCFNRCKSNCLGCGQTFCGTHLKSHDCSNVMKRIKSNFDVYFDL